MKKIILGIVFLLVVGIVSAPNPGHNPAEIDWGQTIGSDVKISGRLGVGTTAAPAMPLDVTGGGTFRVGTSGQISIGTPAGDPGMAFVDNGGVRRMDIRTTSSGIGFMSQNGGNVGIGTTGPGAKLEVRQDSSSIVYPLRLKNDDGVSTNLVGVGVSFERDRPWAAVVGQQQSSGDYNYGKLLLRTRTSDAAGLETKMTILANGNVGIGTTDPGTDKLDVRGRAYASGGWQTTDADYAEWFEKEENTKSGDLIGINLKTGKARKYIQGDKFIGIHSSAASVVGNRLKESEEEMSKTHVLVGLLGQLDFNREQVIVNSRIVKTSDGTYVGVLLSNGKVLLGR